VVTSQLSPAEIQEADLERDRLTMRLQAAERALEKREAQLAGVINAEQNASQVIELTDGKEGFAAERGRARDVIAHCTARRRELEPLVTNWRASVSQIKAQLEKIPARAIQQRDHVRALARLLSSPLP